MFQPKPQPFLMFMQVMYKLGWLEAQGLGLEPCHGKLDLV